MRRGDGLTTVAVSGGAGYVGSVLVPMLLARGYRTRVLDLLLFGEDTLAAHPLLEVHRADVRDRAPVERWASGADAVIHLAGIANDPSCALNPSLSQEVNVTGTHNVVTAARRAGAERFVLVSSASVYGIANDGPVHETSTLKPITVYGETKARAEDIVRGEAAGAMTALALRPAALYGYAPRQRLDLTVNLLTNHAVNRGGVEVFGGEQLRPTLHVADLCDLLLAALEHPLRDTGLAVFNAARENATVADIARRVVGAVNSRRGPAHALATLSTTPSDDRRSYAIDSTRAREALGFAPRRTLEGAVAELCAAFADGRLPRPLSDDRYFNVRRTQSSLGLLSAEPTAERR
ncbi:NAD-dependent epimerase/dehydratase family protein [Streptomyces sp. NPDC001658]